MAEIIRRWAVKVNCPLETIKSDLTLNKKYKNIFLWLEINCKIFYFRINKSKEPFSNKMLEFEIFRRQEDGSWKIYWAIFTNNKL
jgi:hypothetical protein